MVARSPFRRPRRRDALLQPTRRRADSLAGEAPRALMSALARVANRIASACRDPARADTDFDDGLADRRGGPQDLPSPVHDELPRLRDLPSADADHAAKAFRLAREPRVASGSASIDAEHVGLMTGLRAMLAAIEADQPREIVLAASGSLLATCRRHFASEESLLRRVGYPELERHREEHQLLACALMRLHERLAEAADLASALQSAEQFGDALLLHLLDEAPAFARHLALALEHQA